MQIDESRQDGDLWIHAYEDGYIDIDGTHHKTAVCLNGETVLPVALDSAQALSADDLAVVLQAANPPEVVLIGTGSKQVFLHPRISAALAEAGIGVETMSTAAACRTYMILRSEARPVWAWLWP